LLDKSLTEYNSTKDPIIKEAAKRNVGYFSVALNLLGSGQKTLIYNSSAYKEQEARLVLENASDCLNSLKNSKYDAVYNLLERSSSFFGFNPTYITNGEVFDGRYNGDYGGYEAADKLEASGIKPETNGNIIIEAAFKQNKFISKEDVVKMKEIQEECEKKVLVIIGKNNSMEIMPGDSRYSFTTPDFVKTEVGDELAKIEAHKG